MARIVLRTSESLNERPPESPASLLRRRTGFWRFACQLEGAATRWRGAVRWRRSLSNGESGTRELLGVLGAAGGPRLDERDDPECTADSSSYTRPRLSSSESSCLFGGVVGLMEVREARMATRTGTVTFMSGLSFRSLLSASSSPSFSNLEPSFLSPKIRKTDMSASAGTSSNPWPFVCASGCDEKIS